MNMQIVYIHDFRLKIIPNGGSERAKVSWGMPPEIEPRNEYYAAILCTVYIKALYIIIY